ncbi:hypothetical protein [Sphaerotilus hippei]|nr:hypothetical protein [Sphaerotilus hippei]
MQKRVPDFCDYVHDGRLFKPVALKINEAGVFGGFGLRDIGIMNF